MAKELVKKKEVKLVFIGEATEVQLNKWRKEHGTRFKRFDVPDGEEVHIGYFQKPSLEIVQAAEQLHPNDAVANNLYCYDNCHLGGSDVFTKDDEFKFALARGIAKSFRVLTGVLKNG